MTPHPLDPLSPVEIERAAAIVRGHGGLSEAAWFETIALAEPDRNAPASPRRRAFVCCYDPAAGETWDGIADLAAGELLSWQHVKGAQARIVADEFAMGGEIAKADPRFKAACARRGITDIDEVLVEPWAAGHFGHRRGRGRAHRLRPLLAAQPGRRQSLCPADRQSPSGHRPAPTQAAPDRRWRPRPAAARKHRDHSSRARGSDLKPLEITQPEGASFTVEGNCVRWQKWQFRARLQCPRGDDPPCHRL